MTQIASIRKYLVCAKGVIPSEPDLWIWMGDFVYMDSPLINCNTHKNAAACSCNVTLETFPPHTCQRGDFEHSRERVRLQVRRRSHSLVILSMGEWMCLCCMQLLNHGYREFLKFMCPDFRTGSVMAPDGVTCKRPIIGTYDDHDFGYNNGNRL